MDILSIILCLICFVAGIVVCRIGLNSKLKTVVKLDQETAEKNKAILREYDKDQELLQQNKQQLTIVKTEWETLSNNLEAQKQNYEERKSFIQESINQLEESLNKNFEERALELGEEYQKEKCKLATLFIDLQAELTESGQKKLAELYKEINDTTASLKELKAKASAAVEENKRKEQMKEQEMYYRLVLSAQDLTEISHLREVEKYLKDPSPLNKVIWKVYYEKPYTDLIGRVFGQKKNITGIYRITNVLNGKCYVGQAVDVPERWKQHIKRGLGAEVPTKNKLYPAMQEIGPENFIFELLEECSRDKLNEREDYWQDFYQAKEFGYSIK